MNPYEALGVPSHATDDEIKKAYRRLVKQFHPDKNATEDAKHRVVLINAAYEILSDPVKRARYDQPVYAGYAETPYEEDPVEAYKREFKRKRWEKEQLARQKKISREKKIQRVMRIVSFPILVFACVLALDELLPRVVYDEIPLVGWQERSGSSRRNRGELQSYLQTDNFYFRVPHELHLNYQYYDATKPPVRIFATPIFKIPRNFTYTLNENHRYVEIDFTIHNHILPFPWLLLISSIFVVANKSHTRRNYSFCFLPLLFLGFTLLIMW